MTGAELKKVLTNEGYALKDVASMMGMTQPNFSQLMKVQDVKSGTLEQMCQVLNKKMDFFYAGTVYAPVVVEAKPGMVYMEWLDRYEALVRENEQLRLRLSAYEPVEKRKLG